VAFVRFVVHSHQVQGSVEHQHLQFVVEFVAVVGCLGGGTVYGDGQFADPVGFVGGKAEHVGGLIVGEEIAVQLLELGIVGEQAIEGPATGDFQAEGLGEFAKWLAVRYGNASPKQNCNLLAHCVERSGVR
jgi:hypothetical protein